MAFNPLLFLMTVLVVTLFGVLVYRAHDWSGRILFFILTAFFVYLLVLQLTPPVVPDAA